MPKLPARPRRPSRPSTPTPSPDLMRVLLRLTLLLVMVVPAARPAWAAWPETPTGLALSTAFSDQHLPVMVGDGQGGAIVAWADLRSGQFDIWAQRIGPAGDPLWAPAGVRLCGAIGQQSFPVIASDGAGGAIVAWEDDRSGGADVRAQRVSAAGVPLWTADGVAVCTALDDQIEIAMIEDGAGGAILAWTDLRKGTEADLYAQRVDGSGARLWATNGIAVATQSGDQYGAQLASAGAGGAIAAWNDTRAGVRQDVYAARIALAGTLPWAPGGVRVATTAGGQEGPAVAPDDGGGAVVAWSDRRTGFADIAVQRLDAAGARLWGDSARVLCSAVGAQQSPRLVRLANSWGAVWEDGRGSTPDLYAQRLDAAGFPQWTANGLLLAGGPGTQDRPQAIAGAADEWMLVWQDRRSGSLDVYAQKLAPNGGALWGAGGIAVCTVSGDQRYPVIAPDAAGGALIAWEDQRAFATDLYAHRVTAGGLLGGPEPRIVSLTDVPGDEGGALRVQWSRSRFEDPMLGSLVERYRVERLDPAGAVITDSVTVQFADGPALLESIVPTLADALPGDSARTRVRIVAVAGGLLFASAPDSASSLDNIGPQAVRGLSGRIAAGVTRIAWERSPSADAAMHFVHRGTFSGFVADSASFVGATTDTSIVFPTTAPAYYKVVAYDDHGNKGGEAWVFSEATLDAPPAPLTFGFARPEPEPSRGPVRLAFSLPEARLVRLELIDASGRRVRVLADGRLPAGRHERAWDGRGERGERVPAGVYFARLRAGADERTQRLTRLR